MKQIVYITKYALTSGIMECEMDVKDDGRYCYGKPDGFAFNSVFSSSDFFTNRTEALTDSEKRRVKKIESLNTIF